MAYATEHAPALAHAAMSTPNTASRRSNAVYCSYMTDTDTSEQVLADLEQAVEELKNNPEIDLETRKQYAREALDKIKNIVEELRQQANSLQTADQAPQANTEGQVAQIKAQAGLQ